jgi:hypothetical protein
MLRMLEAEGRDGGGFSFAGQVSVGSDRSGRDQALATARSFVSAGADHVVLGIPAAGGPEALRAMAKEVAEPLREAWR